MVRQIAAVDEYGAIQHAVTHLSGGPGGGGLRVRCAECAAETAEAAQFCAGCGAPAVWRPPVAAGPAAGGPGDSLAADADERTTLAPGNAVGAVGPSGTDSVYASSRARWKQQPSWPAPGPGASGAILAECVGTKGFSRAYLRPGYDMEEVDAFLGAIGDAFLGVREPSLTADEIRDKQFSATRLRLGYDEEEVDAFLDEVEARLRAR